MDPMGIGSIHLNQALILGTTSLNKPGAQAGSTWSNSKTLQFQPPSLMQFRYDNFMAGILKTHVLYTHINKYKYDQESLNFIQYISISKKKKLHEFQQALPPCLSSTSLQIRGSSLTVTPAFPRVGKQHLKRSSEMT